MAVDDVVLWGWGTFFSEIVRFIESSERQYGSHANRHYAEYVLGRLEVIVQNVTRIRQYLLEAETTLTTQEERDALLSLVQSLSVLVDLIPHVTHQWQTHLDYLEVSSSSSRYQVPLQQSLGPGRPHLQITQEQLEYLRSLSFSWTAISRMLGVSRMTLHRRRVEYEMILTESTVTESQLMAIVHQLRQELPDVGQTILAGRLRAMGVHVGRHRIREAIRRSDPLNTALRWHGVTNRRPYSVPGPNSLWHIGK